MGASESITVLHVSDMQFGRNHRFGNLAAGDPDAAFDTLTTRLLDDLDHVVRDEPDCRPQLIVVSGDLVEWGRPSEFADALELLDRLSRHLDVPRSRTVVVPGNHDLNRKLCEAYFNECEAHERTPAEPYTRKWDPYLRMFDDFFADQPEIAFTIEEPWTLWEVEELNLVIAGLNSTMRESHRDDDHYGWVGERQLRWFADRLEPYVRRGWFRLGVVHHNTTREPVSDDENLRDADRLADLLAPSLNLLLHGHTHNSKLTWLGQQPLPVLSTGSAALRSEARPAEVPNQYQLIRLDAGGIRRWTRRFELAQKRWVGDTSCSPRADAWAISHAVAFQSVHGCFLDRAAAETPDASEQERTKRKLEQHAPDDGFLARVLEICELRHGGEGTQIAPIFDNPHFPYLRVHGRDGSVAQSFPIGLAEGDVGDDLIAGFCATVFDRYRALDPNLRCTIVYGGERASDDVVRTAMARNVDLRSFVEFQGIVDLRDYVKRQTARLTSDAVYPPSLYVPQQLSYEVGDQQRTSSDALGEMFGWLREPRARFVLVLGDFGNGKTFLLRELARRMPTEIPHLVPVLVELRSLEKARTLEALVAQHLATAGERFIDLEAFPYMLRKGRIALLFDGFDELAMRVTYKRAAEHFETLLQAAGGDAKVVVTSRTQHFETDQQARSALMERAELLPGLSVCRVQPFDEEQIKSFLTRRLRDDAKARERFALIDEIKDLLGLSHNPRMLGFIAGIPEETLREARERTGTITAAQLYRLLIDQWLEYEWDKTQPRGAAPTLSREQRWEAVTALASCLWAKLERTIHVSEMTEQVSAAVQRLSVDPRSSVLVDPDAMAHLVGSRTLLVRDEEGAFAFVHASVMEWFVANQVADRLAAGDEPEALAEREMTLLMTDFVCDLATPPVAQAWARRTIAGDERSVARSNALLILDRLGQDTDGASLAGEDLVGRDFADRELGGATLAGADLTEANLQRADLRGADLTDAMLVRADLTRALLRNATLDGVDASEARLLGADLLGATLRQANLRRAKLVGARVDDDALAESDTFGAALPGSGLPEAVLQTTSSSALAAAFSPDGQLIASGHVNGTVSLWNAQTGTELCTLSGHRDWVRSVAFSPDGRTLASASDDRSVRLWNLADAAALRALTGHRDWVRSVAFSPDGRTLASASDDGTVRLWDATTGEHLRTLAVDWRQNDAVAFPEDIEFMVASVAFSPDGARLASGRDDGVRLWDVSSGALVRLLEAHHAVAVAFSPDGAVLATGGNHVVRLWDAYSGALMRTIGVDGAEAVAFSPDGARVAIGSKEGILLADMQREDAGLRSLLTPDSCDGLAFSPDGATLVEAAPDAVRVWSLQAETLVHELAGHRAPLQAVAFSNDGRLLASDAADAVRLWDPKTGGRRAQLAADSGPVRALAFSPTSRLLASGSANAVRLSNPRTGNTVHTLIGHQDLIRALAFAPNGRILASGGDDHAVHLWDPGTGTALSTLDRHEAPVLALAFAPNGRALASAGQDAIIRLWDPARGRQLRSFTHDQEAAVQALAFSPSGSLLASSGDDEDIHLWDPRAGRLVTTLSGHGDWIRSVAFSPDGRLLASAGDDATVRLWDPEAGTLLHTLTGHQGWVRSVAFSPDGRLLASAGDDRTIRLWDPVSGALCGTIGSFDEGAVAFTPDGRYRVDGRIGGALWYRIGLCRFAPGELDEFVQDRALRRLGPGERL